MKNEGRFRFFSPVPDTKIWPRSWREPDKILAEKSLIILRGSWVNPDRILYSQFRKISEQKLDKILKDPFRVSQGMNRIETRKELNSEEWETTASHTHFLLALLKSIRTKKKIFYFNYRREFDGAFLKKKQFLSFVCAKIYTT